ncbi:SphA family protein [Mucilaginibacter aquaedulcis]|uniref:SphA family protein n=1 Tax=Mucilaginibacter aquaedulcis TaxID=1187081 RepID=UPI0025B56884|nr:transporter [Mucilaginibacter aquaedulcis]MDN3549182.1 transporter [Mucilaginibacter aquaedulcis]
MKIAVKYKMLFNSNKRLIFILFIFWGGIKSTFAQDPVLPATNLGLTNTIDAVSPPPGFYYINYTQIYTTKSNRNASGLPIDGSAKIDYLLSLHQLVYLSKIRVLDGNVHFTTLLPVVKLSAVAKGSESPSVNPHVLGDLTLGTGIQWFDKKLFNHTFWHRVEFDLNLPSGSYDPDFVINPSAHLYALSIYYSFTYLVSQRFSFGSRNQFNYNFSQLNSGTKPGTYYNGNYSIEYNPVGSLRFGIVGYYLKQFSEDSQYGNHNYFQDKYGITNTRERVLGFGPSLSAITGGGIFIEAKMFFETAAQNRPIGTRQTLRVAIPLKFSKKP